MKKGDQSGGFCRSLLKELKKSGIKGKGRAWRDLEKNLTRCCLSGGCWEEENRN